MKDINTILFDVDGTLLDTGEFILQATEYALASLKYFVPERKIIEKMVGTPFPDYYIKLTDSDKNIDKLIEKHREFQYANYHLAKLFPNTSETLKKIKEMGYKLAVVTSRSKKTSLQTLIDTGILNFFDEIVSFEDAHALKPDPAPLFEALRRLNEEPQKAIMVGDSHLDIEAGKNAGTKNVRVTYGFHKDNLHNPEPDFIIEDIRDLLKLL